MKSRKKKFLYIFLYVYNLNIFFCLNKVEFLQSKILIYPILEFYDVPSPSAAGAASTASTASASLAATSTAGASSLLIESRGVATSAIFTNLENLYLSKVRIKSKYLLAPC